mgnify:CR=1 FL=1
MKINKLKLENFMIFNQLDVGFSPDINIIFGENNTGKTALIKLLYSCMKGYVNACTSKGECSKDKIEGVLVGKLQGVFRPDKDAVGRLVNRRQGSSRTEININFEDNSVLQIGFGNRHEKHIEIMNDNILDLGEISPVYIPPKEIISATENFGSLYADYHIAFEETYYDLARLLEKPLKRGPNTVEQNKVLRSFEKIVNGSIIQKDRNFFLKVKGAGEFEMGLVSEGYRKISTLMYLILTGSLTKNAVLFWDEPETNMNPKMIKPIVDAIIELSRMGVQVFITTHDYFVQQCFNMSAIYLNDQKMNGQKKVLQYQFMSLYQTGEGVACEAAGMLSDLEHNAVMEEFDQLYDREQEMLYGM